MKQRKIRKLDVDKAQNLALLKIIWEKNRKNTAYQLDLYCKGFNEEDLKTMSDWDSDLDSENKELEKLKYRQKRYSSKELLEIFPEAREVLIERLKDLEIRYDELYLRLLDTIKNARFKEGTFYYWFIKEMFWKPRSDKIEKIDNEIKKIKRTLTNEENKSGITEEMIIRAKEYPFENLIKVNRAGFALCPFREEKTASFFVRRNFAHCFGCNKSWDTIQFVMDMEGISFINAVKKLQ